MTPLKDTKELLVASSELPSLKLNATVAYTRVHRVPNNCVVKRRKVKHNGTDSPQPATSSSMKQNKSKNEDECKDDTRQTKQTKFSCTTCGRAYGRQIYLIQHQKSHITAPETCGVCSKQFTKKSVFRYHMMLHTGDRPHKCSLCDKAYIFKSSLNNHTLRKHQSETTKEEFECDICRKILTSRKRLEIHLNTTHNEEGVGNKVAAPKVLCPTCGKAFSTPAVLRSHERLKHEVRPKQHICEVCGLDFHILSKLTEHMEKHLGIRKFSCHICNAAFQKKNQLKAHQITHSDFRPFPCKLCSLAFKENRGLKRHEECVHGIIPDGKVRRDRAMPCIVCGKKFVRPKRLEDHMRMHTGERPFACDQCPKCFFSSKCLRNHLRRVHWNIPNDKKAGNSEQEVCNKCNKCFKNRGSLQNHLRRIHQGKKEAKLTCELCNKVMHGNATYRVHMLIHNDEFPFGCDKCDKRVRTKYQLKCHMLNHAEAKSFSCDICNRAFVQKSSKHKHMKKYHTSTSLQ